MASVDSAQSEKSEAAAPDKSNERGDSARQSSGQIDNKDRSSSAQNAGKSNGAESKQRVSKSGLNSSRSEASMAASEDEDTYMAKLAAGDQQSDGSSQSQVLGSRRPRARKTKWTNRSVKLLVIGDSGLGKTTLVRCLLAVPGEAMTLHDGSSTDFKTFNKDPDVYLSTVEWDDEEEHVHWTYQIQDTPGYGDDLDLHTNITRVKQYIEAQNRRWHRRESAPTRDTVLGQQTDSRVDLCVFCLPPHRLRNIDIEFMTEVSKLVPILPVVTKADTMTVKECVNYRRDISQRLHNESQPISLFEFSKDTLESCGLSESAMSSMAAARPPYLVVCSNTLDEDKLRAEEPELWPERRYLWGTSEAFNPQHSDLLLLRRLLLQDGVEEIASSKLARYEAWRTQELKQFKPLKKLASATLTTAVMMAAVTAMVWGARTERFKKLKDETAQAAKEGAKQVKEQAKESYSDTVKPAMEQAGGKAQDAVHHATKGLADDHALRKLPGVPDEAPKKQKKFFGLF